MQPAFRVGGIDGTHSQGSDAKQRSVATSGLKDSIPVGLVGADLVFELKWLLRPVGSLTIGGEGGKIRRPNFRNPKEIRMTDYRNPKNSSHERLVGEGPVLVEWRFSAPSSG